MANPIIKIRFKRSLPGDHDSYGEPVEAAIEKLTGKNAKTKNTGGYPRTRLKDGGGYVERHEDGPEIFVTVLQLIPAYIGAALALYTAWKSRKKIKKSEKTRVDISGKNFEHSIVIETKEDEKLAAALLKHYGKK